MKRNVYSSPMHNALRCDFDQVFDIGVHFSDGSSGWIDPLEEPSKILFGTLFGPSYILIDLIVGPWNIRNGRL